MLEGTLAFLGRRTDPELEGRSAVAAALLPMLNEHDPSRDLLDTDVGKVLQAVSFIVSLSKIKEGMATVLVEA